MTNNRRICPNCGAYLKEDDRVCYVCGEVLPVYNPEPEPAQQPLPDRQEYRESPYEEQQLNQPAREDYAEPPYDEPEYSEADNSGAEDWEREAQRRSPDRHSRGRSSSRRDAEPSREKSHREPREDYDDNPRKAKSYREDYYDENEDKPKMKKSKKVAVICTVCVIAVALITGGVCFCFANGLFGEREEPAEITVYFDKPSFNLNLMDENGVVYNWGADVDVVYTVGDEALTLACIPCDEYENLWKCTLPSDARNIYFTQSSTEELRTQSVETLENETVCYVTEIVFNSDFQLPVATCLLSEFINVGINATDEVMVTATAPQTTEAETETSKSTQAPTETEQPSTADDSEPYSITLPTSWDSGTTAVTDGNCTTYYETYNYANYSSGMLLSVYVYDADDNSYGDLNVKKIINSSDGKKKIVVVTPTDIQFDDSDEEAMEKYTSLSNSTNQVISSIKAK